VELIYLWVEDYKNIKNQGFNFSPRFECEFKAEYEKGKDKLKKDCELIITPKKHTENFFGENINVTAIVGKNGSGKSSLLQLLEGGIEFENIDRFFIYQKDGKYFCKYRHIKPRIIFSKEIKYVKNNDVPRGISFYPEVIKIANSEKIGKDKLSHYYFGDYSGILGGFDVDRQNVYNMLDARFFVPRYINIAIDHIELFEKLKQMYKFDTLRLLLRNNSTSYIRKLIDDEKNAFEQGVIKYTNFSPNLIKVCIYEKTKQILKRIQEKWHQPIDKIEIHLYNRNREKIVSVLEKIENMHRSQTNNDSIKKYNKYQEFDLAVLIAFTEYYLKNTDPCDTSDLVYETLLEIGDEIKNYAHISQDIVRLTRSYLLDFFQKLKDGEFKFSKDKLLSIDKITESIKYIQQFKVYYFDFEGNPYIDIPIDKNLKENLGHIQILQKIFFDHEFDCGKEEYLRVFEYDLINSKIGSDYDTISDGEKHFIQFSIDIIYYLKALKNHNFTPDKESLALFLADEPDNAMHPIWKKRLINSVLEILNNYSEIPNIRQHFIFTTHSPFLLSDIPTQNVIFLDQDENGNCKVVNGLKDKKQTFGANIHTLLSDAFFMEDGLIGEFAKEKIQSVINFLKDPKDSELNRDIAWSIIQLIGEPFLKHKLEEKYHERFSTDEEKRIAKIKQLEDELKRLKNVKSED